MFETAVLSYGPATKRVWTTCLGMTGQCALVALAILIPLMSPAVLPRPQAIVDLIVPPPPPHPPQLPSDNEHVQTPRVVPTQFRGGILVAPVRMPDKVQDIDDPPLPPGGAQLARDGVPGGIDGGGANGFLERVMRDIVRPVVAEPPRPPAQPRRDPPELAAPPIRVRISSIEPGALLRSVDPVYPFAAKTARISGVVRIEAVIGTDGHVKELKALDGNPFLVRAALEAVARWVYRPTILNGQPVEVIAPVTVTFRLN